MQDDEEDWQSQAPQMGPIYSRSFVTISAAEASSSDGGILRPRKFHEVRKDCLVRNRNNCKTPHSSQDLYASTPTNPQNLTSAAGPFVITPGMTVPAGPPVALSRFHAAATTVISHSPPPFFINTVYCANAVKSLCCQTNEIGCNCMCCNSASSCCNGVCCVLQLELPVWMVCVQSSSARDKGILSAEPGATSSHRRRRSAT